jgi:hypothetical protein
MSEPFDPYHKWLGIAPKDQPPNHYRLLGVELFESDPDVIDAAANRVMAYIQSCAQGPHLKDSQRLLNEISAARLCLLDEQRRSDYDAALREQMGESRMQRVQRRDGAAPAAEPSEDAPFSIDVATPPAAKQPVARQSAGKSPAGLRPEGNGPAKKRTWKDYAIWFSPTIVLLICVVVFLQSRGPRLKEEPRKRRVFDRPQDVQAAFEPVSLSSLEGVALDDNQAQTDRGSWAPQQSPGSKYVGRFFLLAKAGDNVARFEVPSTLVPGNFEIRLSYVPGPDRASNAKVQVVPAGGKAVNLTVNQRQPPNISGLFHSLGTFAFQGQFGEQVEISAQGADGNVVVDAVQFIRVREPAAKPAPKAAADPTKAPAGGATKGKASVSKAAAKPAKKPAQSKPAN